MTGLSPGPTRVETRVHRLAFEQAVARGHRLLDPRALEAVCAEEGLDHDHLLDAARSLAERRVLQLRTAGPLIALLRLTEEGFMGELLATHGDIDALHHRIMDALRAEQHHGRLGEPFDLAGAVDEAPLVVEALLDDLRRRGELVFTPISGHRVRIHRLGPAGEPPPRAG